MSLTTAQSREIFETRTYAAPSEVLLRMWSNPEHLTHWWGPVGFSTTTHEMEFKPGGVWRYTMHGPDGRNYPNVIRYTKIDSDGIEYEHGGHEEPVHFKVKVQFRAQSGATQMDFLMTFPSAEERERVILEYGANKGLTSTMLRLDEYASLQKPSETELVIVRKFKAPQELVWKAFTDGDDLKRWYCPQGLTLERSGGNVRVNGQWSSKMITPTGYSFNSEGEYLSVQPIDFLKYTHRWINDDGSHKPTTTISVSLSELSGSTTMVFVQSGFWSEEARAAHLGGWSSAIHQLAVFVGATTADKSLSFERIFDAPIELVWKCWTDPIHVAQWFAPRPYTCPSCELDLRPGGTFALVMRSPDGMEHSMRSEITDIEPNQTLSWLNTVPGFDGEIAIQGGTTVGFEDLGGKTKVTVNTYNAAYTEMGSMMVGGMEMGWKMTLDQCQEFAESTLQG